MSLYQIYGALAVLGFTLTSTSVVKMFGCKTIPDQINYGVLAIVSAILTAGFVICWDNNEVVDDSEADEP